MMANSLEKSPTDFYLANWVQFEENLITKLEVLVYFYMLAV